MAGISRPVSSPSARSYALEVFSRDDPPELKVWPTKCTTPQYSALDYQGQDPCEIAIALFGGDNQCYTEFDPQNPPGFNQLQGNSCLCNTVYYSLAFACGLCTNTGLLQKSFTEYSKFLGCGKPAIQVYPHDIPSGVSIPRWAYLPLVNDKFNIASAERSVGQGGPPASIPISTPPPTPTAASPPPTTAAPASTPSTSTFNSANSDSDAESSSPQKSSQSSTNGGSHTQSASADSSEAPSSIVPGSVSVPSRSSGQAPGTQAGSAVTIPTHNLSESTSRGTGTAAVSGTSTGQPITTNRALVGTRRSHLGAILGGVFGSLAAVALAACIILCLARRRRRRRQKEALLTSGPLDWWRHPARHLSATRTERPPSMSSTIKVDDPDEDDDVETLHATSVEKKSVTYGEYPDI